MENDILQTYKRYFTDLEGKQLSYEAIAMYVMDAAQMSSTERSFFQKALEANPENMRVFQEVFDETIEFDEHESIDLQGREVSSDTKEFEDEDWKIQWRADKEKAGLFFERIPPSLIHQALKIDLLPGTETIRILDLVLGKANAMVPISESANIETLQLSFLKGEDEAINIKTIDIRKKSPQLTYWLVAAGIVLLIGLAFMLNQNTDPKGDITENSLVEVEDNPNEIPVDTLAPETPEKAIEEKIVEEKTQQPKTPKKPSSPEIKESPKQIAETQFPENPILERFISRNVRSSKSFKLISPEIGATVELPLDIKWESDQTLSGLQIILVDHTNQMVWEGESDENTLKLDTSLNSGVYYLKFVWEDEMLGVGKFIKK